MSEKICTDPKNRPVDQGATPTSFVSLFILFTITLSPWTLAYWPGVFTQDSFRSWEQLQNGEFSNLHPYIYTLYLGVFRSLFGTPGAVLTFQLLSSAALGAFFFSLALRHNLYRPIVWLAIAFFALSPAVGIMSTTIWKDVPFSLLVVFWALLALAGDRQGWRIKNLWALFGLSLLLGFTGQVRHNGVVLIPLVPLALWWSRVLTGRHAALLGTTAVILCLLVRGPIASALKVNMDITVPRRGQYLQFMGALLADSNTNLDVLSANERKVVEDILPLQMVREQFSCVDGNEWVHDVNVTGAPLANEPAYALFMSAFKKLAWSNPRALLAERLCYLRSVLFSRGFIFTSEMESDDEWTVGVRNALGLKSTPLSDTLHGYLGAFVWQSVSTPLRLLVWNLWLPFLVLCAALWKGVRGDHGMLSASILVLIQLPCFVAVALAPDWRYFYSMHLSMYFLIPYLFQAVPKS